MSIYLTPPATAYKTRIRNPSGEGRVLYPNPGSMRDALLTSRPLAKDLAAYWRMNESSWGGVASEVVDSSGNGNHGIAVNGATTTASGKLGRGGSFTAASTHYLNMGDVCDFTDGFTIAAWAKGDTKNARIAARANTGAGNTQYQFYARITSGYLYFYDGTTEHAGPSTDITDNAWHHTVAVINGAASYLYLDGSPGTAFNPTIASKSINFTIGAYSLAAPLGLWNGIIDELAVWNRALTAYEVSTLYNGGDGIILL